MRLLRRDDLLRKGQDTNHTAFALHQQKLDTLKKKKGKETEDPAVLNFPLHHQPAPALTVRPTEK